MIVITDGFFLPLLKTSAVFAAADAVHSVVFEHKASAVRMVFLYSTEFTEMIFPPSILNTFHVVPRCGAEIFHEPLSALSA